MISLLSRWSRPSSKVSLADWRVTVYTREHCCCCHTAVDLLKQYQRRYKFVIEEVDIDADPELRARYDTTVPVVAINGKVRFKGVVNPILFDRLLVAEGGAT